VLVRPLVSLLQSRLDGERGLVVAHSLLGLSLQCLLLGVQHRIHPLDRTLQDLLLVGLAAFAARKLLAKNQQFGSKPKLSDNRSDEDVAPVELEEEPEPSPVVEAKPAAVDFPFEKHIVEDPIDGFLSRFKVMVVDDNSTNIDVLVGFLELYGLSSYYIAENGEEACAIAKHAPLDLILMDIQMPKLNGIDATKLIRKMNRCKATRIIGVTAFSRIVNEQMCMDAGMNGFLNKPVHMEKLESELKRVLRFSAVDSIK